MLSTDPKSLLNGNERKAVEIALRTGLLGYPKRARVADIAKLMGISPETFIYHLRRGDYKCCPREIVFLAAASPPSLYIF
jgi:hypothetical protein